MHLGNVSPEIPINTTKKAVEESGTRYDIRDEEGISYTGTRLKMAEDINNQLKMIYSLTYAYCASQVHYLLYEPTSKFLHL
jgi:hypothetical protein